MNSSLDSALRSVQFYTTLTGRNPVGDFLDTLTAKQAKKIAWTLKLVRTLPLVPIEYLKKLTGTQEI